MKADELDYLERQEILHDGQIRCPRCRWWQCDMGQDRCDRYGCNELFDRED